MNGVDYRVARDMNFPQRNTFIQGSQLQAL